MYTRSFKPPDTSFFLFGPRGTGKSSLVQSTFPNGLYIDFLESEIYTTLLASPGRLEGMIPSGFKETIILDEVQRVPDILNEVHRLIEKKKYQFVLTGSNARKLKRKDGNLLAGRALTCQLYPLTAAELDKDFDIAKSLQFGHLPQAVQTPKPDGYLKSYIQTYLREEIQQEGLTRNIAAFARFLETASFSQGQPLNISSVARDSAVDRKIVEDYFAILSDLLLSYELPIFSKKAKRKLQRHRKFFFFDVGVYRTLRPKGSLDTPEEIAGPALETLILQEMKAQNFYNGWDYEIFYWRTFDHIEVDFILYGAKGFYAIEVKRSSRIRPEDLKGLKAFCSDYPQAKPLLLYGGEKKLVIDKMEIIPVTQFLKDMKAYV